MAISAATLDNGVVITRAVLQNRGDEDDDFYGVIEVRPGGVAGAWEIGGRTFVADGATRLESDDGPLVVGACVSVDYRGDYARKIESERMQECTREGVPSPGPNPGEDDDFYGVIEVRPGGVAGAWEIGGRTFVADGATRLESDDGPLVVGACVSVDYRGDYARKIESELSSKCAANMGRDGKLHVFMLPIITSGG